MNPATENGAPRTVRVRRINFDYSSTAREHRYVQGDLVMSHLIAVLSALFPEGEDFFVRSVRRHGDAAIEPALKAQVAGFVGQEVTHGREHRTLNEQLQAMGYPTRRVDKLTGFALRQAEQRLSPLTCLAITAALEHYTAALAETLLSDERAQDLLGDNEVRSVLLWHAVEESEHKAVAFDVYRAAGGGERRRIVVMRATSVLFIGWVVAHTLVALAADRSAYNPIRLVRSLAALRHSPFLTRETLRRLRAYNRVGFHPDENDNNELLQRWVTELFGEHGRLADHLR
jgi:uncharacterized protein